MTTPDANDVLMGGGGYPAVKLDQLRVWVGGRIVAKPTARQETTFGTGEPKTYPRSGDPIMGILVDVQTDQRLDAEDNGIRRLYVEGRRMKEAVKAGVVASGADGLAPGGELYVAWVGEEQGQGTTPAKVYESRYYPPTTPVPGATNGQAPGQSAPMPDPRGQTATAASGTAEFAPLPQDAPPPAFAPDAPQDASPAPMGDPRGSTPAPAPSGPQNGAQSSDPTAEAIAALKAAGLDPTTVFPNYRA